MDSKELDSIHAAMEVLKKHDYDAWHALAAILVKEAPAGWWSE